MRRAGIGRQSQVVPFRVIEMDGIQVSACITVCFIVEFPLCVAQREYCISYSCSMFPQFSYSHPRIFIGSNLPKHVSKVSVRSAHGRGVGSKVLINLRPNFIFPCRFILKFILWPCQICFIVKVFHRPRWSQVRAFMKFFMT